MYNIVVLNITNFKSFVLKCENYEEVEKFLKANYKSLCKKNKITVIDEYKGILYVVTENGLEQRLKFKGVEVNHKK